MQAPAATREVIIPHALPIEPARTVRSTLIQSSLATLKTEGHYERYLGLLASRHRETILGALSPSWLPMEVALAHYEACDALGLDQGQLVAIGERVGDRMQGSFMETLTRAARGMGVTPWVLLKRFDVLWGRLVQGGGELRAHPGRAQGPHHRDPLRPAAALRLLSPRVLRGRARGVQVRGHPRGLCTHRALGCAHR